MSPVDRIHIYQQHNLDKNLLLDSFESLTTREEPIGVEEGMKLGLQTSIQIAMAREKSRGPDTGLRSPDVKLDSPHIRDLLSGIFRIQTDGAGTAGPFTAPLNNSGKLDRASALPAVSDASFFFENCEILMVVSIAFSRLCDQHRPRRRTLQQMIFLAQGRHKKPLKDNEAGTTVVRHGGRFRRLTSEALCSQTGHRRAHVAVVVYPYYIVSGFRGLHWCRSNVTFCRCCLRH